MAILLPDSEQGQQGGKQKYLNFQLRYIDSAQSPVKRLIEQLPGNS